MRIGKSLSLLLLSIFLVLPLAAVTNKPAKVIIVAGQSNTDGRVPGNEFDMHIGDIPNCYWRWGSGEAECTKGKFELFNPVDKAQRRFSRWAYDAYVYQEMSKAQSEPFYVVKWSLGGTAIDTLARSTNNDYWCANADWLSRNKSVTQGGKSLLLAFEELIDDAIDKELSQLPQGYIVEAFLWHQGESDAPQGAHYYENLKQMLHHVRQHLVRKTGDKRYKKLPLIFGTVSERNRQFSKDVKQGMQRLAKEDKNAYLIDMGSAELLSDKLHFTAKSAEQLGLAMTKKLEELGVINTRDASCKK